MSNQPTRFFAIGLLLTVQTGWAQSDSLIDSIRANRGQTAVQAENEFQDCLANTCNRLPNLALLSSVLWLSENDSVKAAERLNAYGAPVGLSEVHQWYWAQALAYSGQKAQALVKLQKIKNAPAWLVKRVEPRRVELLVDTGRFKEAKLAFAKLKNTTSPESLWLKVLISDGVKDFITATQTRHDLAMRFPSHPHGKMAAEQLYAQKSFSFTDSERVKRAQAFLELSLKQEALDELKAVKNPAEVHVQWIQGQCHLIRGQEDDSLALQMLIPFTSRTDWYAPAALNVLARRAMRLQDLPLARNRFLELVKRFPDDSSSSDASYLAAWLAMNLGQFEVAANEFSEFETNFPASKKRDEARWFQGYSLVRNRSYVKSREVLLSLGVDFEKSSLVPQARYWAARSLELQSVDAGSANKTVINEYQLLVNSFRGTWYARLAKERLKDLGIEVPALFTLKPKSLEAKHPKQFDMATQLAKTGLLRDAAEELDSVTASTQAENSIAIGHELQALQGFAQAHALAARYLWGQTYSSQEPTALPLMFPKAFENAVEVACKSHRVTNYFAWSIMRRESAFRPEVISAADARGLMQVIPPTAHAIAASRKMAPVHQDELFSPAVSIDFGVWYLGALFQRFSHPALVAAAYNGGPSGVASWVKEKNSQTQIDSFVEEIPLKETRAYVKQVVADSLIYQELYSNDPAKLDLALPSIKVGIDY
jgi:soluble lytic murein transglycosylase